MPLAVLFKAQVCCRSLVGTAVLNLAVGFDINFLCLLCIELAAVSAMSC
jgi:hypothetical protein